MIRKQFFIEEEQNARLKSAALATGKSEAELIREGIDQRLVKAKDEIELTDWRAGWRKVAGMWADYPEIDEITESAEAWALCSRAKNPRRRSRSPASAGSTPRRASNNP